MGSGVARPMARDPVRGTTCLEYFDLVDKMAVGKPTTMVKSIEAMYSGNVVPL